MCILEKKRASGILTARDIASSERSEGCSEGETGYCAMQVQT